MLDREFGFIQGRLSPIVDGKIQAFPWEHWKDEFFLSQKIGLKAMEWTLDHDRLYENPLLTADGQQAIRELSLETGVKIHSLTADFFMQAPFFKIKNSPVTRDQYLCDLRAVIKACGSLNISVIVLPLVDNSTVEVDEEEKLLVQACKQLEPLLQEQNLRVAFESDFPPDKLLAFINKFEPTLFGINYDIGNSASLGYNPKREIDTYGHRIINVHIKDRILNGTTVPLGNGNADFNAVFYELKRCQYKGKLIFQTARDHMGLHCEALVEYKNYISKYLD